MKKNNIKKAVKLTSGNVEKICSVFETIENAQALGLIDKKEADAAFEWLDFFVGEQYGDDVLIAYWHRLNGVQY